MLQWVRWTLDLGDGHRADSSATHLDGDGVPAGIMAAPVGAPAMGLLNKVHDVGGSLRRQDVVDLDLGPDDAPIADNRQHDGSFVVADGRCVAHR